MIRERIAGSSSRVERENIAVVQRASRNEEPIADRSRSRRVVEVGSDIRGCSTGVRWEYRAISLEPTRRANRATVVGLGPAGTRQGRDIGEIFCYRLTKRRRCASERNCRDKGGCKSGRTRNATPARKYFRN